MKVLKVFVNKVADFKSEQEFISEFGQFAIIYKVPYGEDRIRLEIFSRRNDVRSFSSILGIKDNDTYNKYWSKFKTHYYSDHRMLSCVINLDSLLELIQSSECNGFVNVIFDLHNLLEVGEFSILTRNDFL